MSKGSIKITSQEEFFKALKKDSVRVAFGKIYMGDRHKRTVPRNTFDKFMGMGVLENSNHGEWFEKSFRLKDRYRAPGTFALFKQLVKQDADFTKRMAANAIIHKAVWFMPDYLAATTHTCPCCHRGFARIHTKAFDCCPHCSTPDFRIELRELTDEERNAKETTSHE